MGSDHLPGHRLLRRAADDVLSTLPALPPLAAVIAVVIAVAIGLVAGVSLSGSV
jgi:hypothetical protein